MRYAALGAHALAALFSAALTAVLTYHFVVFGDMPFPSWRRDFVWMGMYFETHAYYISAIIGTCAAWLCGHRALHLAGVLNGGPGLRASSNLILGLITASALIVAMRYGFFGVLTDGGRGGVEWHLTEDGLEFPDLPLADEPEAAWVLTRLDGTPVEFDAFAGKTVFINFWATWCPPCVAEMPNLQRLYDALEKHDDIVCLFVSNEEAEHVRDWAARERFTMPLLVTNPDTVPANLRPRAFPTTIILAPDGRVAFRHAGAAAWDGGKTQDFLERLAASQVHPAAESGLPW